MKYFTRELLQGVNECNTNIRIKAEKQWEENCKLYKAYFDTIKWKVFSAETWELYISSQGFHDCSIDSIELTSSVIHGITLILCLRYGCSKKFKLTRIVYSNVQQHTLDVKTIFDMSPKIPTFSFGYDEFEVEEDLIVHRILFNMENELSVTCKSILIEEY